MGSFTSRGQAWGGFQPASLLNLNFHASRTVETIHFCYLSHSVRDTLLHTPSNGNHRVVLENCIWLSGHLYRQCICIMPRISYCSKVQNNKNHTRCLRNLLPIDSLQGRFLHPLGMYLPEEAAPLNGGLDGCSPARSAHEQMTASPLLAHGLD